MGKTAVKKPKLSDLRRLPLTSDEKRNFAEAFAKEVSPIALAVLGVSRLEFELEQLLRRKLKNNDDETWLSLTEQRGPLSDFNSKIEMGYALGLYAKDLRENLHVVRRIRNAFAHIRRIIDFEHETVAEEYKKLRQPKARTSDYARAIENMKKYKIHTQHSYAILCYTLNIELIKRSTRGLSAATRNMRRKKVRTLFGGVGKYELSGWISGSKSEGLLSGTFSKTEDNGK